MPVIVERHHVLAGVVWLNEGPVRTIERVRCAVDPEAVWFTLRPGRDYQIIDAEGGQIYVSALIGTLIEVTYTTDRAGRSSSGPARHESHRTEAAVNGFGLRTDTSANWGRQWGQRQHAEMSS